MISMHLLTSKQLTDLMGGTINIESTEGVGSRISIKIPFKKSQTGSHTSANPTIPPQSARCIDRARLRILVAEGQFPLAQLRCKLTSPVDNTILRSLLVKMLIQLGVSEKQIATGAI